MTENLPAIRRPNEVREADTDSWTQVVGEVSRLANVIADTAFVPKGLRGSAAATAAAILYGREVGLPPMTALTQTHVIEGKPAVSAEAMRAMVYSAGHDLEVVESNVQRCVMRGRRRGAEEWAPNVVWDMAMVPAQLKGKDNWRNYPRQMLQARCTAELCRLLFPDVIHGFRAVEEFDNEPADGPVVEGTGPSATRSTVQRKTTRGRGTKGEALEAPANSRPALEGPPLPGEPGYTEPTGPGETVGEPVEPGPVPDVDGEVPPDIEPDRPDSPSTQAEPYEPPRPATKADLRMFHAAWNKHLTGLDDDAARKTRMLLTCAIIGRQIDTSNELFQREARLVADTCARVGTLEELANLVDEIEAARHE